MPVHLYFLIQQNITPITAQITAPPKNDKAIASQSLKTERKCAWIPSKMAKSIVSIISSNSIPHQTISAIVISYFFIMPGSSN